MKYMEILLLKGDYRCLDVTFLWYHVLGLDRGKATESGKSKLRAVASTLAALRCVMLRMPFSSNAAGFS